MDVGKLGSGANKSLDLVNTSVSVLAARYVDAADYHSPTNIVKDCLLAALPLEVRQKIFLYVVAGTRLVIRGFSYDPRDYGRPLFLTRDSHRDLYQFLRFGEITNFAIIRTCKRFYYDARFLPFLVNTLDMGDVSNAISFLSTLGDCALASIRAIRIECDLDFISEADHLSCGYGETWVTFCNLAVDHLTNLQELHVDLLGWTHRTMVEEYSYYGVTESVDLVRVWDLQNLWIKFLLKFRRLPLSVVKLIPKNMGLFKGESKVHEIRKWAGLMTAVLLKGKGLSDEVIIA